MTKIEEILEKYKSKTDHYADQDWYDENVEKAMIEYGEWYGKKCLEIAVDAAKIQINTGTKIYYLREFDSKEFPEHESFIDRKSITNIQLPSHE